MAPLAAAAVEPCCTVDAVDQEPAGLLLHLVSAATLLLPAMTASWRPLLHAGQPQHVAQVGLLHGIAAQR
jgi:hypothetical protein